MGDRTSVVIEIGGELPRSALAAFVEAANDEHLTLDWGGAAEPLTETNLCAVLELQAATDAGTLTLVASEVYTGLDALVTLCGEHGLFWRKAWDAYPGSFSAGGELQDAAGFIEFGADGTDGEPNLSAHDIRELGSWEAVTARLERLTRELPPFVIKGDALQPEAA